MVTNAYSFIKPGCWMLMYYFEGDTLFIDYKCVESDHPHCLTCCAAPIDCWLYRLYYITSFCCSIDLRL